MKTFRWLLAWLTAVIVTAVAGSIVQTQINIARIVELGESVSLDERLVTTLQDLAGFAPVWAIIVAAGLLVALPVAGALGRKWPSLAIWLQMLAGFMALVVALLIMDLMLPVTAVAAARSWCGVLLLSVPGVFGGWIYFALYLQRQKGQNFHQAAQRSSDSQAGS